MANINNPKPTNHADTSDSDNKPDADTAGKKAGGANDSDKPSTIEELSPELQAEVNRRLAAARRDGEEKGKNKAKEEAEQQTDAERQKQLEENQEYKPLYEQLKAKLEDAENKAKAVEKANLALEVALEKKLPNPQLAAKRLIGETREELMEDADALLKVLKSDEPQANPEADKKAKADAEANPPATSEGGDSTDSTTPTEEIEDEKYVAQRSSDLYNF